MPLRKTEFINGEIYHITMRGVDGRIIFTDDEDYWRGIFSLYEFNNKKGVTIREQREKRKKIKESLAHLSRDRDSDKIAKLELESDKRERVVDVLAFVFMPNHIHLILRQIDYSGISLFVKKFGVGYAMYFNKKAGRKGVLFQGRFNAIHIDGNEYLKTVFTYIHTNPISIIEPGWKEKGISNISSAVSFLEKYRWSSYRDYIGIKNFPSITQRDLGFKTFAGSGEEGYILKGELCMKQFVEGWVTAKHSLKFPESRSLGNFPRDRDSGD